MSPSSSPHPERPASHRRLRSRAGDERLRRSERAQQQALEAGRQRLVKAAARRDEAWRQAADSARKRVAIVLAVPFAVGLVALLAGIALVPLIVVGAVLLAGWGLIAFLALRGAEAGASARLGGLSVDEAVSAGLLPRVASDRCQDVTQSLCDALGLVVPALYVLVDPAVNAISTGRGERARIYLTTGLLGALERIELEGVLAHELTHIKRLDTLTAGLSLWLVKGGRRRLPFAAALARYLEGDDRELAADLAAVSVTRYPPGLIRALEQAGSPARAAPSAAVRAGLLAETASQWLVTPSDELPAGAFGPDERLAVLQEL